MIPFKEIAESALKFAPTVAAALGVPGASLVASALSQWFGVEPAKLPATINADPDADVKLKQFEIEHKADLQRIAATNYQTEVDDRKNARQREIEIEKITGKTDYVLSSIALAVVVGFFILCGLNYFYKSPEDHIIIMLLGQLSGGFIMVLSYFFGSSQKKN